MAVARAQHAGPRECFDGDCRSLSPPSVSSLRFADTFAGRRARRGGVSEFSWLVLDAGG